MPILHKYLYSNQNTTIYWPHQRPAHEQQQKKTAWCEAVKNRLIGPLLLPKRRQTFQYNTGET